jgi:sensor histidine kinase regulating citrate/malate metabolism
MEETDRFGFSVKDIINAFDESVLVFNRDGKVLIASEKATKRLQTGKKKQATIYEYFPPDIANNLKTAIDEVIQTGTAKETKESKRLLYNGMSGYNFPY